MTIWTYWRAALGGFLGAIVGLLLILVLLHLYQDHKFLHELAAALAKQQQQQTQPVQPTRPVPPGK